MRQLTLRGYLDSYVQYLAGEDTLSLTRLVRLLPSEPRLVAPLLLWATVTDRSDRLWRLLPDENHRAELAALESFRSRGCLEKALAEADPQLRTEYSKLWRSFVVRRDAPCRDADLKREARQRALALAHEKGVSRYRMARDLGLNDGNLHAFLAQGNVSKLSLERALALVRYLQKWSAENPSPRMRA